ncbi:MAG TPA: tetratricopeptide repeat protein [Vicinamibacterales bacterium]|nr:tetratricopeptide repeat protein [Vicinamibacterales bacterium]
MTFLFCVLLLAGPLPQQAATLSPFPLLTQTVKPADRHLAEVHYENGWSAIGNESFEEAVKEFDAAIKLNPRLTLAYYGLGRAYMDLHRYVEATAAYERCQELFEARTSDKLANAFEADMSQQEDRNETEIAVRRLSAAGPSGSNSLMAKQLQAYAVRKQVQRNQLQDLSLASAVPPFVTLALGSAYFRSDRLPDAERAYKATLQADPKTGEAWNNLAALYLMTARYDEAAAAVKAAEKDGFHVNPQMKDDIKRHRAK